MPSHSIIHIRLAAKLRSIAALPTVALAVVLLCGPASQARADTMLLMFEEPGCMWCMRWNEEVGTEYPITPEGQAAPLLRLQLRDGAPDGVELVSRPRYTPTFVLVRDGAEVGRIEGYPGEDFFWGLLGRLLSREMPSG